jgi:predicted DNA-binding transcriptional regulator AlpA
MQTPLRDYAFRRDNRITTCVRRSKVVTKFVDFSVLKERKVVENRTQLKRMQDQLGFPRGVLLSPNRRAWDEAEVEAWIDGRRALSAAAGQKSEAHADKGRAGAAARARARRATAHGQHA